MPECNHCEKLGHVEKFVATKIGIKLILQRSIIKKNVCYMPLKTQSKKKEEGDTCIVDATITWPRMRLFSKALTRLLKLKFDWEMAV